MIRTTKSDAPVASVLCTQSPAKINLSLDILGHRGDGFHDIRSLVLGIDLADDMRFERSDAGVVQLTCDDPDLPTDGGNLVTKAAVALADRAGHRSLGARIMLKKHIPIAAGLGGGSSNAATTLAALNHLWQLDLPADELSSMGAELGSDVPLFFALPSAVISGRGEIVRPVSLRWSGWVLLVFAGRTVSTKDVYAAWSSGHTPTDVQDRWREIAVAETADQVARLCSNDLEQAVFRIAPSVQALHQSVRASGAPHVRITGAGQTAFVLFDDPQEAEVFRLKLVSSRIGTGAAVVKTLDGPLKIL